MLHFLLEIIIMTRSTKTRLLLRDKYEVVHSDRLYRPGRTQLFGGLGIAKRLLGGFGGMLLREHFFKWCNLVRFGACFHNFFTLKKILNNHFLYFFGVYSKLKLGVASPPPSPNRPTPLNIYYIS